MLAPAACGTSARAEESTDTANRYLAAVRSGDAGAVCGLLAPKTVRGLVSGGDTCEQALAGLGLRSGRVRETSVWGDRAQVSTTADTLFPVELNAGWRIAAAGCRRAAEDTYECALES